MFIIYTRAQILQVIGIVELSYFDLSRSLIDPPFFFLFYPPHFLMNVSISTIMLLQDCSFIIFQYNSILKIDKGYLGKEISSQIIPYYYYTTLFVIPFLYTFLLAFGPYFYSIMTTLLPYIVIFLVLYAPRYRTEPEKQQAEKDAVKAKEISKTSNIDDRSPYSDTFVQNRCPAQSRHMKLISMAMVKGAYVVGSLGELCRITFRQMNSDKSNTSLIWYKLKSNALRSLCAWIAQDVFFEAGNFNIIYLQSSLIAIICFSISIINTFTTRELSTISFKSLYESVRDGFKSFNKRQSLNFLINMQSSMLKLFLGIYSTAILFEIDRRSKEVKKKQPSTFQTPADSTEPEIPQSAISQKWKVIKTKGAFVFTKINFYLHKLINLITRIILIIFLTKRTSKKREILGVGYVIGIVKICSTLFAALFCELVKDKINNYYAVYFTFPLVLISVWFFINSTNTTLGNILYFISVMLSDVSDTFCRQEILSVEKKHRAMVAFGSTFISGLSNSFISMVCSLMGLDIRKKGMMYLGLGLIVIALSTIIQLVK